MNDRAQMAALKVVADGRGDVAGKGFLLFDGVRTVDDAVVELHRTAVDSLPQGHEFSLHGVEDGSHLGRLHVRLVLVQ